MTVPSPVPLHALEQLAVLADEICCLCKGPDEQRLFVGKKDGSIGEYSVASGERTYQFRRKAVDGKRKRSGTAKLTSADKAGHSAAVVSIAVSPDGRYLVC
jgi:WD40 repeat protein